MIARGSQLPSVDKPERRVVFLEARRDRFDDRDLPLGRPLADGHITRSEGRKLEAECDEAIAALLAIRERARLAQREGVIAMTTRRGAA